MSHRGIRAVVHLRNRQGIALPVALFALLIITVLITGVLLTGSTEAALGFAQRDATEDLHAAEGAIQAYVGQVNAAVTPGTSPSYTHFGTLPPMNITVAREAILPMAAGGTEMSTLYSVRAERPGGGRTLVATVRARQTQLPNFNPWVPAPLTLGDGGLVSGTQQGGSAGSSIKIDDGTTNPLCPGQTPAENAVIYAEGETYRREGSATVRGAEKESTFNSQDLIRQVLGNISMRDLAWNADIKFGAMYQRPAFSTGAQVFSGNTTSNTDTRTDYDWGCPKDLIDGVNAASPGNGVRTCSSIAGQSYYPVVAIDAQNGTVDISNHHGQGILIVINGTLRISGKFVYKGLILAERNVLLSGAGPSWPPSIEGAIVAAGETIVDDPNLVPPEEQSQSTGHRQIRYNACALSAAVGSFNGVGGTNWGAPTILGSITNWFEVVR